MAIHRNPFDFPPAARPEDSHEGLSCPGYTGKRGKMRAGEEAGDMAIEVNYS